MTAIDHKRFLFYDSVSGKLPICHDKGLAMRLAISFLSPVIIIIKNYIVILTIVNKMIYEPLTYCGFSIIEHFLSTLILYSY